MSIFQWFKAWRARRQLRRDNARWVKAKTPVYGERIDGIQYVDVGAAIASVRSKQAASPRFEVQSVADLLAEMETPAYRERERLVGEFIRRHELVRLSGEPYGYWKDYLMGLVDRAAKVQP